MNRKKSPVMLEGQDRDLLHQLKPMIEDAYERAGQPVPKISFTWIIRAALTMFLDAHMGRKIVVTPAEASEASKRCQIEFGKVVLADHGIEVVAVHDDGGLNVRFVTRAGPDDELKAFDFPASEASSCNRPAVN